jgi:hypothetical protein
MTPGYYDQDMDELQAAERAWLRAALSEVAGDEQPTTQPQALRDLAAGRRSMRRRRVVGGLVAVAAVSAALIPVAPRLASTGSGPGVAVRPAASGTVTGSLSIASGPSPSRSPNELAHPRLQGDGLSIEVPAVDSDGNQLLLYEFKLGSNPEANLEGVLTAAFGRAPSTSRPDCGQGPRTQSSWSGFSVLFDDGGQFVGWTDETGVGMTDAGIRVGATLTQLRRAFPDVSLLDGSLGTEWTTRRGLSGLLNGTKPTSKVTTIYAGETCFAR